MILIKDVKSMCRAGVTYGRKGEKVKLIARHGHVLIVENLKGEKYPVNEKFVIE